MSDNCALCAASGAAAFTVAPRDAVTMICATCRAGLEDGPEDAAHWKCLHDAIWSEDAATQVLAWRLLNRLDAAWARDLLDIAYLEPDRLDWAQDAPSDEPAPIHRDANGAILSAGDTVTLIKDLQVKGAGFTAKRGTAVRRISLSPDNAAHIEGRVAGQHIVILTEFVKKS